MNNNSKNFFKVSKGAFIFLLIYFILPIVFGFVYHYLRYDVIKPYLSKQYFEVDIQNNTDEPVELFKVVTSSGREVYKLDLENKSCKTSDNVKMDTRKVKIKKKYLKKDESYIFKLKIAGKNYQKKWLKFADKNKYKEYLLFITYYTDDDDDETASTDKSYELSVEPTKEYMKRFDNIKYDE